MSQWIRQAAAIPIYEGRVCLVTSRSGRRWVFPKGLIDPGQTAGETALKESWEEAGVAGALHAEPLGSYLYEKYGGLCHVTVFLMQVTEEAADWPERPFRQRVWVPPGDAIDRIKEPGLREILDSIARTLQPPEAVITVGTGTI